MKRAVVNAPVVEMNVAIPSRARAGAIRYDWASIPAGGSFEIDASVRPQSVISSFGAHLAAGKYRVKKQANGKYRFWRIG